MEIADFDELLAAAGQGPLWSMTSEDFNVNLVRFEGGNGVASHVNDEVDVLVIVIAGKGIVEVDGVSQAIAAGQLCLIPKGVARSIRSAGDAFAYLSCHRRRGGIWPR